MGRFDQPTPPPDPALARIEAAIAQLVQTMGALNLQPEVSVPPPSVSLPPPNVNVNVPTEGLVDALVRAYGEALAAMPEPPTPQISLDGVTADADLTPLVEAAQDQRAVLEALQEKLSNLTGGTRSHFDGRLRNAGRAVERNNPLPVFMPSFESTGFGELVTVQRTPIFTLSPNDPVSILRDVITETNNGTVTNPDTVEFLVDAPSASDVAVLQSARRGRYEPGYLAEAGMGIRLGTRSAGSTVEWGPFDGDDGFSFRRDDDGFHAAIWRDGSESYTVSRDSFNVDRLDGGGPSGLDMASDIDAFLQQGHVWQVRWIWYGFGVIEWGLVERPGNRTDLTTDEDEFIPVHRHRVTGSTSVREPNLPVRVTASDGSDVYVAGRQYSIYGNPPRNRRVFGDYRFAQSVTRDDTFQPLIALRRRTDVPWPKGIDILTDEFEVVTDEDMLVQEFVGASVSGGSWAEVQNTDGNSGVEVNLTCTGVTLTNAIGLDPLLVTGAGGPQKRNRSAQSGDAPLPANEVLVLAARSLTTGADATVDTVLSWTEQR